jgi:predicted dehydrogenase
MGMGRVAEVSAVLDFVDDKNARYDRRCKMQLTTERGLVGNIVQDVITKPAQKQIRIQGSAGFIEWHAHRTDGTDAVIYTTSSEETKTKVIKKKRADDFIGEINHIEALLKGNTVDDSPISLERGLNTMMVVAAAHKSHAQRRIVRINYKAGYTQDALEPVS